MAAARTALLVIVLASSAQGQGNNTAPTVLTCPDGTPAGCNCLLECCAPGQLQFGDNPDLRPSFCTDKPFQQDYKMRIYQKVPVQINLRDYCTDEILFTSYSAPKVDKFSMVEFPCTYRASDCSQIPDPIAQEECQAGFDVYTKQLNCSSDAGFFKTFVDTRICKDCTKMATTKEQQACRVQQKELGLLFTPGRESYGTGAAMPAIVGACNCNYSSAIKANTGKTVKGTLYSDAELANLTVGVPNGFIKEGMSSFYVEVVIGGRSTAERGADTECMCKGPADTSSACMCELGSKKVPYVYNNSYVPSLTALVSMRKGQLFYTNTFIKWNFEMSGKSSCNGCAPGSCCLDIASHLPYTCVLI